MFKSASEVIKFIKDEDVKFLDVRFTDLPGVQQHFNLPVSMIDEDFFVNGQLFDASSIRGFASIHESDMQLIPDVTTAYLDTFRVEKTLVINFDIYNPRNGEIYGRDPRQVAKKAEAYLASTGIADTAFFAPEAEFFIFDEVRYETKSNTAYHFVDSIEGAWNSAKETESDGGRNLGNKTPYKGGYFPVSPVDHLADIRDEIVLNLEKAGLQVERSHHEVGTAGQCEINYRFNTLLNAADDVLKFKYIVKNTSYNYNKTATFMAFTNPTVNSYHRLVPGFEAPVNLVYSAGNRSAAIRIPMTGTNPKAKRIEFRAPDASGNPYLAFAAMLMAGLDGIKNRIEPHAPVDKDLYELPAEEAKNIPQVPGSLDEVLRALEADHDYLLAGDVFTKDLIETWIDYKREREIKPFAQRPHPYEFELYYGV